MRHSLPEEQIHALKNSLTVIKGNLDLVHLFYEEQLTDPSLKGALKNIYSEISRINSVLKKLDS